jgi:hypothetical protein
MSETPIEDGHRAEMILQDEVFIRAVTQTDARFVQQWRDAATPEERERAHALQAALIAVVRELGIIRDDGEIARRR